MVRVGGGKRMRAEAGVLGCGGCAGGWVWRVGLVGALVVGRGAWVVRAAGGRGAWVWWVRWWLGVALGCGGCAGGWASRLDVG